ncbi:hypothetical protein FQN49_003415, partial [Arthroderma sp. PD_2]
PSSLCWDEELLRGTASIYTPSEHQKTDEIRWRSLETVRYTTTFTPPIDEGGSFFTAGAIQRYSGESVSGLETLSAFYDHSFAFHEGISPSSFNDTRSFDESGLSTNLEDSLSTPGGDNSGGGQHQSSVSNNLSNLEDMPDATYIQGLAPRMVTVNLIVAVITVEQRRRVRTRWGRAMDIIELLVGDETKSGFRISCWIAPHDHEASKVASPLERTLEGLRPCDIILLRSVALSCFRDQVYGQSLRNNATKLDLLHRRPVDARDPEGLYPGRLLRDRDSSDPQMAKVARVRSWTLEFIGPAREAVERAGGIALPPDSQ